VNNVSEHNSIITHLEDIMSERSNHATGERRMMVI